MNGKWRIRRDPFTDAMVRARIGSAKQLAEAASISRGTAETAMRGDGVSYATVLAIVQALRDPQRDDEPKASEVFEAAA